MAGGYRSRSKYVCAAMSLPCSQCTGSSSAQAPPPAADPAASGPHRYGTSSVEKPDPLVEKEKVVDVRVVGNQHVSLQKITKEIHTRAGRPFDSQLIEEDVRRLTKTRLFVSVDTTYQHAPRAA